MDLKLKSPEKNNEDSQNMEEWLLESNVDYNSLSELGKKFFLSYQIIKWNFIRKNKF